MNACGTHKLERNRTTTPTPPPLAAQKPNTDTNLKTSENPNEPIDSPSPQIPQTESKEKFDPSVFISKDSEKKEDLSPAKPHSKPIDPTPMTDNPSEDISSDSTEQEVVCENSSSCPESIGILRSSEQNCTAALFSPDRAVVDLSCLPEESKDVGALCENISLDFPRTMKSPSESARCEKITLLLGHSLGVIKLDRPLKRSPLQWSSEGLPQDIPLSVTSVHSFKQKAQIKTENCHIQTATALLPQMNTPHSPIGILPSCGYQSSQQGGVAFDSEGKARGIIFDGKTGKDLASFFRNYSIELEHADAVSYVANAICFTSIGGSGHEDCKKRTEFDENLLTSLFEQKQNEMESHIEDLSAIEDAIARADKPLDILKWKPYFRHNSSQGLQLTGNEISLAPECIYPPKDWLHRYDRGTNKRIESLNYLRVKTELGVLPVWKMTVGISRDLQIDVIAKQVRSIPIEIKFYPRAIYETNYHRTDLRTRNGFVIRTNENGQRRKIFGNNLLNPRHRLNYCASPMPNQK